jgi:carbon monoxide dehydrogenase subunit G
MIVFEGKFLAPGAPNEVIRRLCDVERVARSVPGASIEGRNEDGTYRGVITVAFGPKKLKFKGVVNCSFDVEGLSGELTGRGAAAMNAARIEVRTRFNVSPAPDRPAQSVVTIASEAELSGALASLGQTAALNLANAMMAEFEKNLAADFAGDQDQPPAGRPDAIGAGSLLRSALGGKPPASGAG